MTRVLTAIVDVVVVVVLLALGLRHPPQLKREQRRLDATDTRDRAQQIDFDAQQQSAVGADRMPVAALADRERMGRL